MEKGIFRQFSSEQRPVARNTLDRRTGAQGSRKISAKISTAADHPAPSRADKKSPQQACPGFFSVPEVAPTTTTSSIF